MRAVGRRVHNAFDEANAPWLSRVLRGATALHSLRLPGHSLNGAMLDVLSDTLERATALSTLASEQRAADDRRRAGRAKTRSSSVV